VTPGARSILGYGSSRVVKTKKKINKKSVPDPLKNIRPREKTKTRANKNK